MSPTVSGLMIVACLFVLLATGMPIAFALGLAAFAALYMQSGAGIFYVLGDTMFSGIANLAYVSIPMFVLMGAAVASSPAGSDLYTSLDRWLNRIPGGLILSNIGACAIFSGMTGSSPATCAAIGKMGIPEMMRRGYPASVASGSIAAGGTLGILIPPSVTLIVYGIATETSIGRLFMAGILPGILLTIMFMTWAVIDCKRKGYEFDARLVRYSMKERLAALPRILPFLLIIAGTLYVLYGGIASLLKQPVRAIPDIGSRDVAYRLFRFRPVAGIFGSAMKESVMIMMIMAAAELFAFALSSLFITQTVAAAIADMEVNRWVLMAVINVFLLICGMFLPPVAVIVMTSPMLFPIVTQAGFDPYWFAIVLTINMEVGLITPPIGLNLFVINAIAPQIPTKDILWGSLPYVLVMFLAIILLCVFPDIATWLPNQMLGTVQ